MAIATVAILASPSPRHEATASAPRTSSRVYSPFANRRLARPMAIPAELATQRSARGRWLTLRRRSRDRST